MERRTLTPELIEGFKVLVVEDDVVARSLLQNAVALCGYPCSSANESASQFVKP